MTSSPRILEKIIVVDEDGRELRRFIHESDPRFYVLINVPPEAEWIMKTYRCLEHEAKWFTRQYSDQQESPYG
jgi:hypothetical protein